MNPSLLGFLRRYILCRIGWHGARVLADGSLANCCGYCGQLWRPEAWHEWDVKLRDGSVHRVLAINSVHAGSKVVYGDGPMQIDAKTGQPIGEVKVHRANIVSAVPLKASTQRAIALDRKRSAPGDAD
jgi:hypothetical protein